MTGGYVYDGREHNNGAISIGAIANGHHQGAIVAVTPGSRTRDPVFAAVPADEVPDVARRIVQQMHEAAGLVPPVVLDRPETAYKPDGYQTQAGKVYPFYGHSGAVVAVPPGIHQCGGLTPAVARVFAAALVAVADDIEAETGGCHPKLFRALTSAVSDALADFTVSEHGEAACAIARAIAERYDLTERKNGGEET